MSLPKIKRGPLHGKKAVPIRDQDQVESCIHLGDYLTPDEVNDYRKQLDEGKIPCRTCPGNAPGGIPAQHCRSKEVGPFTWLGKCKGCKKWDDGLTIIRRGLDAMELPPDSPKDRGVILCGGGDYAPGIYVAVKMIKQLSPSIPITVFHREDEWLPPLDAEVVEVPSTIAPGWPVKSYALLKSPYRRSLYLDSDFYPTSPIEPIFDVPSGIYALNYWHNACQWEMYGLNPDPRPGIDGGCWMIDKERHWCVAWLFYYLNTIMHKKTYQWSCGDEGQLRAAIHAMKVNYDSGGYAQAKGPARLYPIGVHRVNDKFRVPGTLKLNPLRRPTPCSSLPYEAEAFKHFYDFLALFDARQTSSK